MRRALIAAAFLSAPTLAAGPGPDVIIGDLNGITHWTSSGPINGLRAYSFGPTFCNLGSTTAQWVASPNPNHPVMAENLFRIADGRIDHIGLSWAFHEFFPLQQAHCSTCTGVAGSQLGIGCSTVSSANIAGQQTSNGSRAEVNASTGALVMPSPTMSATGDAVFKRLQAAESDLLTPNAQFFGEIITVHPGDALAGNNDNNSSFRRLLYNAPTGSMSFAGATTRAASILEAWKDNADGNGQADPFIRITPIDISADGRLFLATRAQLLSGATWQYTYALYNLSSDRSVSGLAIPKPSATVINNPTFHAPAYHSGEPYESTPWSFFQGSGDFGWNTDNFNSNPNANAVRWGTLYTYTFQTDAPPVLGTVLLSLYKSGAAPFPHPLAIIPGPANCSGDTNGDGLVNFTDINNILSNFGQSGVALPGDLNGDGAVNFADLNLTLSNYANAC